ncbi:MAG: LysR family transcriptional regulator [Anaerolineae bacterium]|nr:LysR family transcriptional regulator [Anaerolineae bacterium]
MELHQLRGFMAVARSGSFTQAAEELYLTQPALSLQIKALEESLGERLFERRGRRLLLTPAGSLLLERAEQILGLLEQTNEEIVAFRGLQKGRLSIGTNDSNCLYVLPRVIQKFREQFPNVELHLTNSHSTEVAAWVVEGRVEFGLVTLPILEPNLESQPLFEREDVLVCHPDHPLCLQPSVTLAELVTYPLLLLDRGSVSRVRLEQLFAQANLLPKVVMEVGSIEVIKRFVAIDLGVSIIPRFTAEQELQDGRLYAIHLDWLPHHAIGIVQRRNGYLSPAAQMFLQMLKRHVASD